ncbi:DUF6263 family protein [Zobellia galactanivorans]|uniref:DUF6263 family protein n=1 Tax=Zobellia TaxID=112040 RepID=UPI0026E11468|nr:MULTISPECIES: DUF6263 family protein [Zobellia]MDO6517156.1 DUF6263 family protein [Zobellia uliginosa]MDO6807896.1 DUF6263 family protein [Zobellia galactanivorans]
MRNFFGIIFIVLSSTISLAQTKLEYKLEKNAVFTIKQNAEQIITQELDGASHVMTNKINGILEFKVLEVRDSTYKIALKFKDLNLNMKSSIQGELLNVRAKEVDPDDMQSQIFNSLLNRPVNILLAKTGNIIEVKGGDSLVVKMAEASGLTDEFSLKMMKKSLEKEFGSEALSKSYEQMTYIYPKKKVRIGDTWKNKYTGKLESQNTWTLKGLTADTATIDGTAEVHMDVTELATTMKLDGSQKTQIITDTSTGFVKKMTVKGLSNGSSTMTQMGDQEIPTTIESSITYELIDNLNEPINN